MSSLEFFEPGNCQAFSDRLNKTATRRGKLTFSCGPGYTNGRFLADIKRSYKAEEGHSEIWKYTGVGEGDTQEIGDVVCKQGNQNLVIWKLVLHQLALSLIIFIQRTFVLILTKKKTLLLVILSLRVKKTCCHYTFHEKGRSIRDYQGLWSNFVHLVTR